MKEVIVRLTSDHIKVKGGEYVQDLVRCKECTHGKYEFVDNKDWICCKHHYDYWTADDFCSYGEREGE